MRVLFFFLFLWSSLVFGQVYQWVDENGVRHFSDQPPPDGQSSERARTGSLSTYSAPPVPRVAPERDAAQSSGPASRSSIIVEQSPAPLQDEPKRNEWLCQSYLDRLERIRVQLRSGYREPTGNRLRAERRDVSARYRSECT